MLRIYDIKLEAKSIRDGEIAKLKSAVAKIIGKNESSLKNFSIYKKSVDARKKNNILFVYACDFETADEMSVIKRCKRQRIEIAPDMKYKDVESGTRKLLHRPIIVGAGPTGLFAGLLLARRGYAPIIVERGEDVDNRAQSIEKFWSAGVLDTESNVQFGEGGAGTFSDGKLTTLINDERCRNVLEAFIEAGAPEEILYKNKPHIGTDILRTTVKRIREQIIALGGEVQFKTKLTDIEIDNGKIVAITVNGCERIDCEVLVLAIGHSARDTFEMIYEKGLEINQKPFAIGVRVEHEQKLINASQYGNTCDIEGLLGAADYKLTYHSLSGRSAYTFCMCPGGYVVAAASEKDSVVTNGMSEHKRDGKNANSALLVNVKPEDFGSSHPLAGVEFQRRWERLAFECGGGDYSAPVQTIGAFLADRVDEENTEFSGSYRPGVKFADLRKCLPEYVTDTLCEAIKYFDNKISGFASPEGILTGVETRSSSPIRILRNENHISNVSGIYTAGEGAGYAGGIMSSAVDGIKTAEKIISEYATPTNV